MPAITSSSIALGNKLIQPRVLRLQRVQAALILTIDPAELIAWRFATTATESPSAAQDRHYQRSRIASSARLSLFARSEYRGRSEARVALSCEMWRGHAILASATLDIAQPEKGRVFVRRWRARIGGAGRQEGRGPEDGDGYPTPSGETEVKVDDERGSAESRARKSSLASWNTRQYARTFGRARCSRPLANSPPAKHRVPPHRNHPPKPLLPPVGKQGAIR